LCGVGFSLVPALQATRAEVATSLKEGAVTQLRGYRRFGMRNLLMVGQVAGSLMLLLITGFLVIGFDTANQVQARFDPNRMILLSIDPVRDGYPPEKAQAFLEKLPARLRAIPGVSSMALAAQPPFSVVATSTQLSVAGDSRGASARAKSVSTDKIGAGYFAALNERVIAGREFDERDQRIPADESKTIPLSVLLNENAVHALFADGKAVGKRVTCGERTCDVIGVVPDFTNGLLADSDTSSTMYLPLTQRDFASPPPGGVTIMARFDGGADALRIEREIAALDPRLAVFNVETLSEHLEISRALVRFSLDTYSAIGLFGLILAAIGLAGVTAYAVARRRKEIGIRMALRARKSQVLRLVLREGTALVAVGTALGFLGAVVVRVLSSVARVFADALNVSTSDPRLLLGAPLLLAAIAMLACYLPARRSATIDPLKALRQE
jgi:predicted permease